MAGSAEAVWEDGDPLAQVALCHGGRQKMLRSVTMQRALQFLLQHEQVWSLQS